MYKAILFAPDGDWVTDYRGCKTIEEVDEYLANKGSRWFFYPFAFVIKDHKFVSMEQPVLATDNYFEYMKGCKLKTIKKIIKETNWENVY